MKVHLHRGVMTQRLAPRLRAAVAGVIGSTPLYSASPLYKRSGVSWGSWRIASIILAVAASSATLYAQKGEPPGKRVVKISLKGNNQSVDRLHGRGRVKNHADSSAILTIDMAEDVAEFSGVLEDGPGAGSLSLVKTGSGTQRLVGRNTYTGTTTVSSGTLVVDGEHAGGAGDYLIGPDAILAGSGSISATINLEGVISPGSSPGTLGTGSQTWNNGSAYEWEINDATGTHGADPGWDLIEITGSLQLGSLSAGGYTIEIVSLNTGNEAGLASGFGPTSGVDYNFIIATTTGGIVGFDPDHFILDTSGFQNSNPHLDWQISADTNNLYLNATSAPEPSSTALLGLGVLGLALRRTRN